MQVVNEYERAVIFRLGDSNDASFCKMFFNFDFQGRLKHGGARGPGLFFVLPYVDTFRRVGSISFQTMVNFLIKENCRLGCVPAAMTSMNN